MDDLTYNYFLKLQAPWKDIEQLDITEVMEAQLHHIVAIRETLLNFNSFELTKITKDLKNKNAFTYLNYGALKRLMMIYRSLANIINISPPNRMKPLSQDEINQSTLDINMVYMNISAILDNFAWALLFEKKGDDTAKIPRHKVNIFSPKLYEVLGQTFKTEIEPNKKWSIELKAKRDPVAHRIPLCIPPSFQTKEENKKYQNLFQDILNCSNLNDEDVLNDKMTQMEDIGTFIPCFLHHPDENATHLYPTLSNDIYSLIKIGKIILKFF